MAPPSAVDIEGVTDTSAVVVTEPLTVNGVPVKRAKSGKLVAGVAAGTSSDFFKSTSCQFKPKSKNFEHRLTEEAASRAAPSLKGLAKYLSKPGILSLGGGLPSSEFFPFESIDIKVPQVGQFSEQETRESGVQVHAGKHDVIEDKSVFDLSIALNYAQGTGSAQMLRYVTEHTEIIHDPPYSNWQCALSVGSTSSLDMLYRMFVRRGDYVLSEEYMFATAAEALHPMGVKIAGIKMDSEGLIAEDLEETLNNWNEEERGAKKPFVLYLVPTGQNPTGATMSFERRKQVYKVAQKHDLIIFEDEPYYYLQMQPYQGPDAPQAPPPASHEEFVKALVPSFLSIDTDGRVIRLDSFSKVIAPGARVGWIVAPDHIVDKFVRLSEVSVQTASGMSQMILFKLLDETWGHGGYLDWLIHIRVEYTKRRDVLLHACEAYLPGEIASWTPPAAGMFHWIKLDWKQHPHASTKGVRGIEEEILETCIDKGVLLVPGSWFLAEKSIEPTELFLRATFASAPFDKMSEAIKRLGEAIRASFGLH
ncbi:PLP-dependent transferase [Xylona heveae TC161]|uniref:aromatic-amino-acid transaminase n=1 Tax=Xylona heveae (strain CBS 132557 / TC161) TaxID=1328760 RepID=A0A165JEV4_XYLHT|nr:PLP-dependent transferase [Xylona heveae TC161]KZF26145.1 PLP-dependent transferase [Xylona heveae TC161]